MATELTTTATAAGNNENFDDSLHQDIVNPPYAAMLFVFPEQRDITHLYIDNGYSTAATGTAKIEWSNDSTTGTDGTWTTASSAFTTYARNTKPSGHRNNINPITGLTNVKMVKITYNTLGSGYPYYSTIHFYGRVTAAQTLHRLRFWHPTLDEPLGNYPAYLDWGNVPQGSSASRQFRVKNDSTTLTASGITAFMQALSDSSPTQVSQHELSQDGTAWAVASTVQNLPNLGPQAISALLHIRRNTSATAQLGIWRQRLVASAATWA